MKHIQLKVLDAKDPAGNDIKVVYADYIKGICSVPSDPRNGMSFEEIRNAMRVFDALEKRSENGFDLEDADYEYLQMRIKNARFNFASPAFIEFVNDITGG